MGLRLKDNFEVDYDSVTGETIFTNLNTGNTFKFTDAGEVLDSNGNPLIDASGAPVQDVNGQTGSVSVESPITKVEEAVTFTESEIALSGDYNTVSGGSITTSVGYDLSSTSYSNVSFDASGGEGDVYGMAWGDDGAKMYVIGRQYNSVAEYDVSTPYDVSTASYNGTTFGIGGQEGNPNGMAWNDDGTKMYVVGETSNSVFEYDVSTPYDVSTASYNNASFDVSGQETATNDVAWGDDGSKMYVIGDDSIKTHEYDVSTPYDVSTASYSGDSLDISGQDTGPASMAWNGDGTKMYAIGPNVYRYDVSTPYHLSTASYSGVSFDQSGQEAYPTGMAWGDNGTKMYVVGSTDSIIYQYDVSLPPLPQTATVKWNDLQDIRDWDIATFQATPDGGSVTVDVIDTSDSSVLVSDINRDEDISHLSNTIDIGLKFTLDGTTGTNYPAVQYAALRFNR